MTKAAAFLIAHGAGTGPEHPSLLALEAALAPLPCRRMAFPYRAAGRKAPDRAPVLIQAVKDEAASLADEVGAEPASLVLGGRSMGGRMCSMAVADGLAARAVVLICYPLHPPAQPTKLRVEHLAQLTVPCLFVSGTRDPFGTPDELTSWTATIPGPVTHHWIEGARHDLKGKDAEVAAIVAAFVSSLR
jgi:predicted alpha/beta-hydrolase family hydrolase